MRENRLYSCASSEGWRVQWGIKKKNPPEKKSGLCSSGSNMAGDQDVEAYRRPYL
jgi:hypothetical protein